MRIKGLKRIGEVPETVKTKSGKIIETGNMVARFRAKDGSVGTYEYFLREAEKGRLHGNLICSS
jgi:hypothetical protein